MIKEYQLRKLQNSYEVTLHYKGVKVRVAFTGGNVYNGSMPKLRTNDPFKMKAIEASELFKNKEVVLVRSFGESTEVKRPVVQQRKKATVVKAATVSQHTKQMAAPAAKVPDTPNDGTPVEAPANGDADKKVFENLGDAIMFIAQNYQLSVQTESEARKVLKEHGVKATIKKG